MCCCSATSQQIDPALLCHRANNDLQTVINILGLLATRVGTAQELLAEAGPRIASIAAVYALVEATGCLPTLPGLGAEILRRTQARHPLGPQVNVELPPLSLGLKVASALGLWLGEVLEAAFRGWGGTGEVALRGKTQGNELIIAVEGTGSLEGWSEAEGVGVVMAKAVAEMQLGGSMSVSEGKETWKVQLWVRWPPER